MEFGSKYVYKYNCSSEESMSDDDGSETECLTSAIVTIDAEERREAIGIDCSAAALPPPPPTDAAAASPVEVQMNSQIEISAPSSVSAATMKKRKRRLRKPDTNVVSIKFNKLLQPGEMHAGDPVYCSSCHAIASHLSQIQEKPAEENSGTNPTSVWRCDFCPAVNDVDIEPSDLPKKEDATYLLSPAPVVHGSDMTGLDDSLVIFLIDISGSMSTTTLVSGNITLPNIERLQERAAANFEGARIPRRRQETYVSRLQGVQMAVDANLAKLLQDNPTRRAALLTFNHEITYYGDGSREEPLVIRGDKLNSTEAILQEAERQENHALKPISQTKALLTERIYDLEEGGQTALGPAVLFALSIASKRRGSRIVICTDGLANKGLGNLDSAQDEKISEQERADSLAAGNEYYSNLTERARNDGTMISVVTIAGTTCLLSVIGQMADGTGGNVNIVDLLKIRDEFASILEQKVIATNVQATLIVHRGLYIRDPDNLEQKLDSIKRDIGNVTKQTEVTFEFGVRNKNELKEKFQVDLDQLKQLPFQIQVTYTASDGSKALRVLTQLKESTQDRILAECNAHRTVLAENHIRSTAVHMMADDDEDDDEGSSSDRIGSKMRMKWSSPIMQKQRMAYMSNVSHLKHMTAESTMDSFDESAWNRHALELNRHVAEASRVKKSEARFSDKREPESTPGTGFFSRINRLLPASIRREESATASESIQPRNRSEPASKKSYGFSGSKLRYQDKQSEDLYQYKNASSAMFRLKDKEPAPEQHEETGKTNEKSESSDDEA